MVPPTAVAGPETMMRPAPSAGSIEFLHHPQDLTELLNQPCYAHILTALSTKPMRYPELLAIVRVLACSRNTGELPASVFDQTLTVMQHTGLVTRHDAAPSTPTYALTLTAVELLYALRPAQLWITAHPEAVEPTTPLARFRTNSITT